MDHVIDMIMLYMFNNGALTWYARPRVHLQTADLAATR